MFEDGDGDSDSDDEGDGDNDDDDGVDGDNYSSKCEWLCVLFCWFKLDLVYRIEN